MSKYVDSMDGKDSDENDLKSSEKIILNHHVVQQNAPVVPRKIIAVGGLVKPKGSAPARFFQLLIRS